MTDELPDLEDAVAEGTHLQVLEAMAALAARELAGNRCSKCQSSTMKMGEISSLMLRLQKIFEEIEAIKSVENTTGGHGNSTQDGIFEADKRKVVSISDIRNRSQGIGNADPQNPSLPSYGTKSAPRKSGSRKSSG